MRATTTAPTIATRIRIDVASNANTCRVKRLLPISATELTDVAAASRANHPRPTFDNAQTISTPSSSDRTAPTFRLRGPMAAASPTGSSREAFRSMTTKRKSTMIAPA